MSNQQLPSYPQAINTLRACQTLSNFYRPINLFRFDTSRKQIYILAGVEDTLEISVDIEGRVEVLINDES